ncbi:60S ribosomal protein L5, mitochondrial [Hordeum vulgare]|nr:60S ribosomal protein L5, mitochondrial [Hordeum vulgare]
MAFVPGAPRQRPAKSSCMVVSTPLMEEEAYRLRTTALLLTATSACLGISPDMVVDVVQRNHRFHLGDIEVAPCFPEDFILTLAERFQRDLVFEARRNRSALFAWLWTWNPDMIPRAADFTVLSRPDCVRSRESLPEGAPVEEGKEGPFFPVLIHLDEATFRAHQHACVPPLFSALRPLARAFSSSAAVARAGSGVPIMEGQVCYSPP